jgi:TfoX/Sxy family transcriptional regulator of competence genes
MAYDEGLAKRMREVLEGSPLVTEKKMFGGVAFLRDGLMFVGVSGDELMARVGADYHDTAVAQPGVRVMDFTGKPMRGYVFINADAIEADKKLAFWIQHCLAFVQTLPPKKPKVAAKPKAVAKKTVAKKAAVKKTITKKSSR